MQLFHPSYAVDECTLAIREVLKSGWTGRGRECALFEESWSRQAGAKYCHFLNSGTAALHIGLHLLDLPARSKVLSTPLTFISTNAVILYEGHEPVFVDVNEEDLSMHSEDFYKKRAETNAKAAIWVHYGGQVSSHFQKALDQNEIFFIEDCAHASGSCYWDGNQVGSRMDTISCFSFQAVKNLPTFDAGMICCPSLQKLERVKRLSWLGIDKDTYARTFSNDLYQWSYQVPELGWKYNGNDIAAAIANVQFKYLQRDNQIRRRIYESYFKNFQGFPQIRLLEHSKKSAHHLIVIRVKNRDEVILALKKRGIAPGVHYLPNYEFPPFSKFYVRGSCPIAENISSQIMSLPNHLLLDSSDIDQVCDVVIKTAKV